MLTKVFINRVHSERPSGVSTRWDHIWMTAYSNDIWGMSTACSLAVIGVYGAAFDRVQSAYMYYARFINNISVLIDRQ